jgi:hypothetical protein
MWTRILWWTGGFLFVVMLFHVAALVITGGPVTGPVSLRKPATFAETGWLVAWSAALILPMLRTRAWQRHVIGTAVVAFGVIETTVMAIQAWRGVPSHYNFSTPFDAALVRGGAAGTAGLFLIGVLVMLVATLRTPGLSGAIRLGVVGGVVVLLVACLIGLVMVFNNSGVYQGSVGAGFSRQATGYLGPDAATLGKEYLLLRPFTRGGDLVLPHAIGVHGLLLLAVPAVLLARTSAARQLATVATMVASVGVAMVVLLSHAFRQLPLSQLNPVELALLALCGVGLVGSYVRVATAVVRQFRAAETT